MRNLSASTFSLLATWCHSPLILLRIILELMSSSFSLLMLMLKNFSNLPICFCIRQQPHDAWSVTHTAYTHRWVGFQVKTCRAILRHKCRPFYLTASHLGFERGLAAVHSPKVRARKTCCPDRKLHAADTAIQLLEKKKGIRHLCYFQMLNWL